MNAESSRSHSIFAIMVEAYDSTSKRTTVGKLSIVDLAGSIDCPFVPSRALIIYLLLSIVRF